jgi:membrane-bound lytic murein transglycosylase MltF
MAWMSKRLAAAATLLALAGVLLVGLPRPAATQPATPARPPKSAPPAKTAPTTPKPASEEALQALEKTWTGDLDGMIKRRTIRALVVQSKTFYFVDRGRQRGASYDALKAFEDELNKRLKTGHLRVNVVFIPVSREALIPGLVAGRGDIAAANLTITPERQREVDFSAPVQTGVREIPITGNGTPKMTRPEDLSGREVFVRQSSSYHQSLVRLNAGLEKAGKKPVRLRLAPEALEDEDLLEMVQAGLVPTVIVDSHKAQFWVQIFPRLTLHPDAAVREGGSIAWAFRKGSPKLAEAVNRFVKTHGERTAFGNEIFRRYLKSTKWVKSSTSPSEVAKFERTVALFRKYGDRYEFDYLLITAQGYQESQLDQSRRSPAGAIGVMQVLPATGKEQKVGDIRELDPNVHAGVKYLRSIADRYFKDATMDPVNRGLFTFAAYNAGPAKIARLREEAARAKLDPNVWFNNVEVIAAKRIGRETVQYVSNIYKYYIAYKLLEEERLEREQAKKTLSKLLPAR